MRKISILILMTCAAVLVFAGDSAAFTNLGFSADGNYFLFGQYGTDVQARGSYADLYLVDVRQNSFVREGVFSAEFSPLPQPGQSAQGALFSLLYEAESLVKEKEIDFMETGRLVYLYIDTEEPPTELAFRDFSGGWTYSVELKKNLKTEPVSGAFHLEITRTHTDGREENRTIGLPEYYREQVVDYLIDRILLGPGGDELVVVVTKYMENGEGPDIRYMVETAFFLD